MPPTHTHPHRPKRLLITGIAGFLGRHLARVATDAGWEVVGVVRTGPTCSTPNMTAAVRADLAEPGAARDAVEQLAPDAVVHAAANARTNECEMFPDLAWRDNVLATELLAAACEHVPLVVCSTDLVFDGDRPGGLYAEADGPKPINAYGRSKLAMEERLGLMDSHAVVARLPLLVGPPAAEDAPGSFLTGWVEQLRLGRDLVLFTDEWRTPLSVREAARGLLAALEHGRPGETYHLAGPSRVSRYELGLAFAGIAADALGIDASRIKPGVRADVPMPAPRAADVSLDGSKARTNLRFTPAPLESELAWTAGMMAAMMAGN